MVSRRNGWDQEMNINHTSFGASSKAYEMGGYCKGGGTDGNLRLQGSLV